MSVTTISKTLFINASRETVWPFLVEKDRLAQWYHPAENDLKAGESYALIDCSDSSDPKRVVWGTVLEMTEPEKLVTTFNIAPFKDKETIVTWLLQPAAGGTRISLTHQGIAEASGEAAIQMLQALDTGWDKHIERLRNAVPA